MADNKLELVVTVEVDKANQSIKSVNTSLSSEVFDVCYGFFFVSAALALSPKYFDSSAP
jgi:hypothetical protein